MNIILLRKDGSCTRSVQLTRWYHLLFPLVILGGLIAGVLGYGYYLGTQRGGAPLVEDWQQEMLLQRQEIETTRMRVESDIDALTRRVGELQGHITRLDALGNKLVNMAGIDNKEFDFSGAPALGGPADATGQETVQDAVATEINLLTAIEALARQVEHRSEQLLVLDEVILSKNLQKEIKPAGRPIRKGWISSYYGMRTDPFTGKPEFHRGMDLAGKKGSPVIAVASGVVTWAGKRYGYGNMVEINHGNSYVTRYGHGAEILVTEGQAEILTTL